MFGEFGKTEKGTFFKIESTNKKESESEGKFEFLKVGKTGEFGANSPGSGFGFGNTSSGSGFGFENGGIGGFGTTGFPAQPTTLMGGGSLGSGFGFENGGIGGFGTTGFPAQPTTLMGGGSSGFGTNAMTSQFTSFGISNYSVESDLKIKKSIEIITLKEEHTKKIELLKDKHQNEIELLKYQHQNEIASLKTTTKKDFPSFVANPMKYFSQDFNEKKEHIQEFYTIYKSFCTGKSNQHLLSLLIKKMKSGDFNDLYPDSFFRENAKELFISTLYQAKENNSWSKELRMKCRKLDEMILEKYENLKELEIYKLVFGKLFEDWVEGTSNFMEELDSMVEFKKNLSDSVISAMFKTLNERTKPELIFTEIEETFNNLKLIRSLKYGSEFDLFVQMNSKFTSTATELKSEIQRKDSEIKELKLEMERLNLIICQNEKLNPDLPHDMVYFQHEDQ
jgi:hypothetical protein